MKYVFNFKGQESKRQKQKKITIYEMLVHFIKILRKNEGKKFL